MKHELLELEQESFFRYDLEKPPVKWSTDFHSKEYDFDEIGHKNRAGLFFFTNSEQLAMELGQSVLDTDENITGYYLTKCNTISPLKIIDLSKAKYIYQMLCVLSDIKVDVLNDNFKTYENFDKVSNYTFKSLKLPFETVENDRSLSDKQRQKLIDEIKIHSECDSKCVGLFGQRLTDFDNGKWFRKAIDNNIENIDGYRWIEFNNHSANSYCLMNSDKLTIPQVEFIKRKN